MKLEAYKHLNNNVRDYTDVETPCSIPNQEAKHIVGDDTTPYWQGESSSLRTCYLNLPRITLSFFQVFIFVFIKLTKALRFFSVF